MKGCAALLSGRVLAWPVLDLRLTPILQRQNYERKTLHVRTNEPKARTREAELALYQHRGGTLTQETRVLWYTIPRGCLKLWTVLMLYILGFFMSSYCQSLIYKLGIEMNNN